MEQIRRYAAEQGLTTESRFKTLTDVCRRLAGIQSQVLDTPVWTAKARGVNTDETQLKELLTKDKTLVRAWTVRGALHTLPAEDAGLFRVAFKPEWDRRWGKYLRNHLTDNQRHNLQQLVLEKLANGPKSRETLYNEAVTVYGEEKWVKAALSSWGGVFKDLSYGGRIIHCGADKNQTVFSLTEDWGRYTDIKLSPDEALAEVLRRYLHAYGPAEIQDFSHWTGSTVKRCKQAAWLIQEELKEHKGTIYLKNARESQFLPAEVRLIPKFDPYMLAHKRKFYLDPDHYHSVFKKAGHVEAVILHVGKVAGIWKKKKQPDGAFRMEYTLFAGSDTTWKKVAEEWERVKS